MRSYISNIWIILTILLVTVSCENEDFEGSDTLITEERVLNEFTRIEVEDVVNVRVTRGSTQRIEVTTNENLSDQIKTQVNNGTLNISLEPGSFRDATFEVVIQVPELDYLELRDATKGVLDLTTDELSLKVSGSSKLELQGEAISLTTSVNDAGRIEGFAFVTGTLQTASKNASVIEISCDEEISGTASDASRISFRGMPTVNVQLSDAAQIIDAN